MSRASWACGVNLLVPGSGLILLRREWFGMALALLFGLVAQFAIVGTWIVPRDLPAGWALSAWILTGVVWVVAQGLVWRCARVMNSPVLLEELAQLRELANKALERGDLADAQRVLLVAMTLNDEDVETSVAWAQVQAALGRRKASRRAWRRVLQLGPPEAVREQARHALSES